MKEEKIMTLLPMAPRYEFMDPPVRPDKTFNPVAFKGLFYQCLDKGDINEDARQLELLGRLYDIFRIPAELRDIV